MQHGEHSQRMRNEKSHGASPDPPVVQIITDCPKDFSKSKKDGNWWTFCLQTSCYDQKFIFAKRTTQKIHFYPSANKNKFFFAKLATEFLQLSSAICLEASTQMTLKSSSEILLLGLWRLIKSLRTGGRALKHSCIWNPMHIYNLGILWCHGKKCRTTGALFSWILFLISCISAVSNG